MRKTAHIAPTWWLSESRRQLAKRGPTHLAAWEDLVGQVAGQPPLPPGVAPLPLGRRS